MCLQSDRSLFLCIGSSSHHELFEQYTQSYDCRNIGKQSFGLKVVLRIHHFVAEGKIRYGKHLCRNHGLPAQSAYKPKCRIQIRANRRDINQSEFLRLRQSVYGSNLKIFSGNRIQPPEHIRIYNRKAHDEAYDDRNEIR